MTAKFSAEEIVYTCRGKSFPCDQPGKGRIVWQVDEVQDGDWFQALSNELDDGHDDLALASSKGAKGCIVNRRSRYAFAEAETPLITVSDKKNSRQ
ncbi:MAG: hypothetical protein K2X27_12480 [Candidatus Obscuribacterales bacterium]|nr:hypothetical protein [Candidatus Obscuribacterales bacterium]